MSSKYDLIKISVHVPNGGFYVLSRFLLARMIHFCEVRREQAGRIALMVKKALVLSESISVTHNHLVSCIQRIMNEERVPANIITLFPVVDRYFLNRVPLLLVIATCGSADIGARIVSAISSRLLNPTLLQTASMLDYTRAAKPAVCLLPSEVRQVINSLISSEYTAQSTLFANAEGHGADEYIKADDATLEDWRNNCDVLRGSVVAHAQKAAREGRELIVSGPHIDERMLGKLVGSSTGSPEENGACAEVIKIAVLVDATEVAPSSFAEEMHEGFRNFSQSFQIESNGQTTYQNSGLLVKLPCDEPLPVDVGEMSGVDLSRPLILHVDGAGQHVADWVHRAVLAKVVSHMKGLTAA